MYIHFCLNLFCNIRFCKRYTMLLQPCSKNIQILCKSYSYWWWWRRRRWWWWWRLRQQWWCFDVNCVGFGDGCRDDDNGWSWNSTDDDDNDDGGLCSVDYGRVVSYDDNVDWRRRRTMLSVTTFVATDCFLSETAHAKLCLETYSILVL